jgi:hypothetical protein
MKATTAAPDNLALFQGRWRGEALGCGVNSWGYTRDIFVSLAIADGKIVGKIKEEGEPNSQEDRFTTTARAASFAAKDYVQVTELLKLKFDANSLDISAKFDGCPMELTRN